MEKEGVKYMIRDIVFFVIGGIVGGINAYFLIRQYRKSLGFKPDPFEPENIYLI